MELSKLKLSLITYPQPDTLKMHFSIDKILLDDLRLLGPNPLKRF